MKNKESRAIELHDVGVASSHLLLIIKSSSLSAPVLSLSRSLSLRLFVILAERAWLATAR